MAPVPRAGRRWGMKDIAVLWISMSACIPTYMLASGLIDEGMNWWQAVLTIFLGNVIVLMPMVLNAHAGTKYGIPFPVYCRASFGILGANVPALLRALVACGWFGIQTWIGGCGDLHDPDACSFPPGTSCRRLPRLGINAAQLGCFLFFWLINMFVIYKGIESIRILLNIKAPLLIAARPRAVGLGLLRGRRLRRHALAAVAVRRRRTEGGQVLGVLHPGADRQRRASGPRSRSTFPTSAATPARSATRCSARRSACRRRWACTHSSAWRSHRPRS